MRVLFLLPLLCLLTACANLSLTDVYRPPSFDYQKTQLTDVSLSALSGTSHIRITNANPYSLPISHLKTRIQLEGQDWLNLDNSPINGLAANTSTSVGFQWSLVYSQLIQRMAAVYEAGEAHLTLVVEPTFDVPVLGSQSVIWTADFTVPVLKMPTLTMTDWRVKSVSFTKVELGFDLAVKNPNTFAISTQNWRANLNNAQGSVATLKLADSTLARNATTRKNVTLSLSLSDAGMSLVNGLRQGQWPRELSLAWQGDWSSPDLDVKLPTLKGKLL